MVVGIVLAAGRSTRMGRPKQLLPLRGKTVIEVVVTALMEGLEEVVVVLGHKSAEISAVLAEYPVRTVVNEGFDAGMTSSIQCGIAAAPSAASGYLIVLGDQPAIDGRAVATVVDTASTTDKGIVIPRFAGRRGHPIYLAAKYGEVIARLRPDQPLNLVTRGYPQDTFEVDVEDARILEDMDTPEDYQRELDRG